MSLLVGRVKTKSNTNSLQTGVTKSRKVSSFLKALRKSGYDISQSSTDRFIILYSERSELLEIERVCRRYNFLGQTAKLISQVNFVKVNAQHPWYVWSGLGHNELREFVRLSKLPIPRFACAHAELFPYKLGVMQRLLRYFSRACYGDELEKSNDTYSGILDSYLSMNHSLSKRGEFLLPHIGSTRKKIVSFLKKSKAAQIVSDPELREKLMSTFGDPGKGEPSYSFPIYQIRSIILGISIDMIVANFGVLRILEQLLDEDQSGESSIEGPLISGSWPELVEACLSPVEDSTGKLTHPYKFFQQAVNFRHEVVNSLGYGQLVQMQKRIIASLGAYLAERGVSVHGTNGSDELIISLGKHQFTTSSSNSHQPDGEHLVQLRKIQRLVSEWRFGSHFRVSIFRTYPIFPVPRSSCYPYILEHWVDSSPESNPGTTSTPTLTLEKEHSESDEEGSPGGKSGNLLHRVSAHVKHLPSLWHSAVAKWILGESWNEMDRVILEQGATVQVEKDDIFEVIG